MSGLEETEAEIKLILSKLFEIPMHDISDNFDIDCCEKWDSISHLKLIASIEDRFGINLSPEEQSDMLTFGIISGLVREKQDID